jgi:hypothetical protein
MLECDEDPIDEGSSAILYRLLKSILMILPQSTSYNLLQNAGRRNWLGYANEKDEKKTKEMYKNKANCHSDVDKTYSKSYRGFHGKEAGISLDDREDEHDYPQKESKKNSTDGDNNDVLST